MTGAPDLSKPRPKARSSTAKGKKDASGLGRAIINRRAKEQKRLYEEALHTSELPSGLHSVTQENDLDEFLNTAQLAATDFTAERQNIRVLATSSIVQQQNPYLLSEQEEQKVNQVHKSNKKRLRVPRRPEWTRDTTKEDLERRERDEFLEWRKGLAEMEDNEELLLTPFERNLSVWRQLWRTLERSHLVVQIVDARNPLGFRCEDLETYVKEVGTGNDSELKAGAGKRRNLLLVNKSDLLTESQRQQWADYFDTLNILYAFFSAKNAVELQEEEAMREQSLAQLDEEDEEEEEDNESEGDTGTEALTAGPSSAPIVNGTAGETERRADDEQEALTSSDDDASDKESDAALARAMAKEANLGTNESTPFDRTQVLAVEQLEELFLSLAPDLDEFALEGKPAPKFCVGLVGYPNVGKSSTINALVGQKKVSVSSTPGKTKNFQTIHLSDDIVLCDCPGLVFPQFAMTKASMVCDGVLPIDQMREHTAPIELVTRRIPKPVLEGIYGIRIPIRPTSEGGSGIPTAAEFLSVYAVARGFFTSGMGNPDESRASRYILKDYVNAKLLYCHPPPSVDSDAFNAEARDLVKLALSLKLRTKRAPVTRVGKNADTFIAMPEEDGSTDEDDEENDEEYQIARSIQQGTYSVAAGSSATASGGRHRQSARADAMDRNFFSSSGLANPINAQGRAFVNGVAANMAGVVPGNGRVALFSGQRTLAADGSRLSSRKMRELESIGAIQSGASKKHYKGNKRHKQRSGAGNPYE